MRRKVGRRPSFSALAEASRRQMARYLGEPTPTGEGVHPSITQRQREISRQQFEENQRLLGKIAVSRNSRGDPAK